MPTTAIASTNLKTLEETLQQSLNQELMLLLPMQVSCSLQEKTLIIWVQHPQPKVPRPQRIFKIFEPILLKQKWLTSYGILIYLQLSNQARAYAQQKFNSTNNRHPALSPEQDNSNNRHSKTLIIHPDYPEIGKSKLSSLEEIEEEDTWELPEESKSRKYWLTLGLMGMGVVGICFFGAFYFFARPCAIGTCRAIADTQQLVEASFVTLQEPQSGSIILLTQKQLNQSIETLQRVPRWSSRYQRSQELAKSYQIYAQELAAIIDTMKLASKAANMSQSQALSITKWQSIRKLWQEAIARLEKQKNEEEDSPFNELIQLKIHEYQVNLIIVNQRLRQERKAHKSLKAATEAAQLAQVRQGVAESARNWQQVHDTWQTAVEQLEQISEQTTPYTEAQTFLEEYQSQFSTAKQRYNTEAVGNESYSQAVNLANLAKNAEKIEHWGRAVTHWHKAIEQIKQVPKNTFHYAQTQNLINTYQQALQQAEGKVNISQRAEEVRLDLEQVCTGNPKICDYSIGTKLIKVHLTPNYIQQMRQSSINAQYQQDQQTHLALQNHVFSLQRALEAISNKAGIPVVVYLSDGTLVETHKPN